MEINLNKQQVRKLNGYLIANDINAVLSLLKEIISNYKYGFANVAKKTKKSRTSLYKTLSIDIDPHLVNFIEILNAINLTIEIKSIDDSFPNQPERSKREDTSNSDAVL